MHCSSLSREFLFHFSKYCNWYSRKQRKNYFEEKNPKTYCLLCVSGKNCLNIDCKLMKQLIIFSSTWDLQLNVQASPFQLEIKVTIKRTEYDLYPRSNTQTQISIRREGARWKGQETGLLLLACSFRVKFFQRGLKEHFCCEKTIAENC